MSNNPRKLYIVIGCDTDPDRAGYLDGVTPDALTWRGMTEGIPRLKDDVASLRDHEGKSPVFTWLLRVDEQVRRMQGSYAWVLRNHTAFLQSLESSGDELGWHPHFWKFDDQANKWYQEAQDVTWQIRMLQEAHRDYMSVLPGRALSVRMGWDYHNTQTYATLEQLGVRVEFSAIPGMCTIRRAVSAHPENLFDWYPTPRHPFYPSRVDYRRPAAAGEEAFSLLEAPNFVSTSHLWGLVSGLQLARKMRDRSQLRRAMVRPTYWINITGRPRYFAPILTAVSRRLSDSKNANELFVTYFHPDELLPNRTSLYSLQSMHANIESLLRVCHSLGVAPEFIRASQVSALVQSKLISPAIPQLL